MPLPRIVFFLTLVTALGACAAPEPAPPSGKARFPAYPQMLFDAFRASCEGPARDFATPARNVVECRELMPPEITASVILGYDGTTEDLPRLVIRFRADRDAASYLVTNDVYLNVPQKRGGPRRIPIEDRRLARELQRLYAQAGGVPAP
ncbi:MAG: hypothetical protein EP307_03010 [Rhodobacteraceae bacterium]|nr:MAG: hypothetical protein EP307_03010 [Paracoccaceae bacterium]